MGYSPWGHKELDIPEATQHVHMHNQKTCENCHHLLAQGNANQDYSEMSRHIYQNSYHQKDQKQQMLVRMWRKQNPHNLLVGM